MQRTSGGSSRTHKSIAAGGPGKAGSTRKLSTSAHSDESESETDSAVDLGSDDEPAAGSKKRRTSDGNGKENTSTGSIVHKPGKAVAVAKAPLNARPKRGVAVGAKNYRVDDASSDIE